MAEAKKEAKEKKGAVTREEFDNLCASVRKMKANWKRFCAIHVGDDDDGRVGSVRVSALIVILFAGLAIAASNIVDNKPGPEGAGFQVRDESGVTIHWINLGDY